MGGVAFVLDADGEAVREAELRPGDEVGMVFVRAKADASEGVERARCGMEILFRGERISGVAGADALHSRAGVDGGGGHGLFGQAHGGQAAKGVLLPKMGDAQAQIVVDGVPDEGLGGGDGAGGVDDVDEPLALIGGRTGRVSSGDSQRACGLALGLLGRRGLGGGVDGRNERNEANEFAHGYSLRTTLTLLRMRPFQSLRET